MQFCPTLGSGQDLAKTLHVEQHARTKNQGAAPGQVGEAAGGTEWSEGENDSGCDGEDGKRWAGGGSVLGDVAQWFEVGELEQLGHQPAPVEHQAGDQGGCGDAYDAESKRKSNRQQQVGDGLAHGDF